MVKINLASAPVSVDNKTKKVLKKGYLSTLGFYGMMPTFYWHQIGDEKITGKHKLLSRANPLVLPAMVDAEFHVNDFYVRWRDIWPCYNEYESESIFHFSNNISAVPMNKPYIQMGELVKIFTTTANGLASVDPSGNYDFQAMDANQNNTNYKFTTLGAEVFKLLCNLGYRPNWNEADIEPVNVMALLAYMKIFFDWYYPPQYLNNLATYNLCVRAFNNTSNDTHAIYLNAITQFLINGFGTHVYYDDDSLSVVWERPNAPADANAMQYGYQLNTGNISESFNTGTSSDYAPFEEIQASRKFTALGLQFLQKFAGYVKRHQLAGARFVDRFFLSRGLKLEDSHRAIRLGESRIPVRIGDVESNASSTNGNEASVLGELAGKSISWNDTDMSFSYDSQSFDGIFISITSLVANARFGTGMDRHNMHFYRQDDWMPAYDALGCAGVRKDEVYQGNSVAFNNNPNGIFGWLPRYYEYLLSKDVISGDFVVPNHGSAELSGYHLFRDYDLNAANMPTQNNLKMNFSFLVPTLAQREEMNRLFYNVKLMDQFIVKFDTFFDSYSPKKPLGNNYDFVGDEGHKVVSVESQGVHVQ